MTNTDTNTLSLFLRLLTHTFITLSMLASRTSECNPRVVLHSTQSLLVHDLHVSVRALRCHILSLSFYHIRTLRLRNQSPLPPPPAAAAAVAAVVVVVMKQESVLARGGGWRGEEQTSGTLRPSWRQRRGLPKAP